MLRLLPLLFLVLMACGGHDHSYDFDVVQHWKSKRNQIFLVEIPYNAAQEHMKAYGDTKGRTKSGITAVYFYLEGSKIPGIAARHRWTYSEVSEYIHSKGFDRYSYRYLKSQNTEASFDLVDPGNFIE